MIMGCCWASQLKGKGYWRKGAANELELSTYAPSKVVASHAIDPGWDPLSPISRMCQSWVCVAAYNCLRPVLLGWYFCGVMVVSSAGS